MSHATAAMARVQHPTKSFRQVVTEVDDTWAVTQDDIALVAPFLDGEMLDLDMPSARSGTRFVDHGNGSLVVNEERGSTRSNGLELLEHETKVFGGLRACHGSIELGLSRAGSYNRLHATLVCNSSMTKEERITRNGSSRLEFSRMGSIKEADQLVSSKLRKRRERRIIHQPFERDVGEIQ